VRFCNNFYVDQEGQKGSAPIRNNREIHSFKRKKEEK